MTMPRPLDLREALALHTLGLIKPEELPHVATLMLEGEFDTPALRRLAVEGPESTEITLWLQRALSELGLERFDDAVDAGRWYIQRMASRIARGDVAPLAGASAISRSGLALYPQFLVEADPFTYCLSEIEDRPSERQHFEQEILKEARRQVSSLRGVPPPASPG